MNARHEKRIEPPRFNQIPAADMARMERDGLGLLYVPTRAEELQLTEAFERVWDLFYNDFVKDGRPILTILFTWDGETSTGDFAPPNDAICCGWENHAGIGVEKTAFLHDGDYLAFLLLHELAHLRMGGSEGEGHDVDFENQLQYLLSVYNDTHGTHMENDFAGFKGEYGMKRDQKRADSMAAPASWVELLSKAPTESKESRPTKKHKTAVSGNSAQKAHRGNEKRRSTKKRKVAVSGDSSQKRKVAVSDDSSQSARRKMIQRMQQRDKKGEQTEIRKDYSGVHKG